jgi:DNA polymerase III subunit gamma/tau
MASQSLYRKWRSQTFNDLVGQEPVIRTLKNALSSGKLAHAYLFTGPRGTGKTSTARLLAKTINCEHPVNGEPCNTCQQCREITAGNSFNVIEIDAASNRGIDSIRDLRDKVMMPPSTGKYKVYVLDEAHMLTTEAFNALLKTLEEPPDYAIFVMATTDVHKMLPTVLSRCQRFDFKRITTRQIVEHLLFVAEHEHVMLERPAAELIARAAAGGMRDALSLLDQAIAYSGTEISLAQVQAMLGVADPRAIQKLINHVAQLDSAAVLHLIHELAEAGADLRQLNAQVCDYWRAVMLAKAGADIATILDRTEDETHEIQQVMHLFTLGELTEHARIFAQNDLMQKNQGTPQLGLELAFLQSIELHRRVQSGQPLNTSVVPVVQPRPALVQSQVPAAGSFAPQQAAPIRQPLPPRVSEEIYTSIAEMESVASPAEVEAISHVPSVRSEVTTPAVTNGMQDGIASSTQGISSLTVEQVKEKWERVKKRVRGRNQTGPKTAAYLNDYTVVSVENASDAAIVFLQAAHTLHYEYMQKGEYCADVEWALTLELNEQCRVRLLAPGQPVPVTSTPITSSQPVPIVPQFTSLNPPAPKPIDQAPRAEATHYASNDNGSQSVPVADSPVAKKNIVRENTTTAPLQPSTETLKQKASNDPVVQAVIRTFTAEIKDIRPK